MIPVYTQKTLDKLAWPEIQKLHKSLGLKAAPNARTRRDLQVNIVAAMPQPVAEPEQIATSLTCATCPLAILIEDNRYECGAHVATSVTRGHWEAKDECYTEVAAQTEPVAEVEAPIAPIAPQEIITTTPATIVQTPHANVEEGIIVAMTKRTPFQEKMDNLDYLYELEMKAQLAVEATIIGSEDEAEAYRCLRAIEGEIKLHNSAPELPVSPVITQLEIQMKEEVKKDVLKLFKIEAFHPSVLPTDEPEQPSEEIEVEPEGVIHWEDPANGTIAGSKGNRKFYVRNNEIFVMFPGDFTAAESKRPNVRHAQIRDAINTGRAFNPKAFKDSPQFLVDTKDYGGIGRIRQGVDGRWWAWSLTGITGHPFFSRELACKYLDRVAA